MKTRLLEMIGAPLARPWWRERWHDLRDSWSYSFALSTLFHVAVIIGVGSMWFFANHDSGISSLDTRWTDTVETPVLEDAVEMAWAKPEPDKTSGGSQPLSLIHI